MKEKHKTQVAWGKAVNNKDNWSFKDPTYGNKVAGSLEAEHYLAYNIVRGLPLERGFGNTEAFIHIVDYLQNINKFTGDTLLRYYVQHFGGTVSEQEFKEKANEALRLYSNS